MVGTADDHICSTIHRCPGLVLGVVVASEDSISIWVSVQGQHLPRVVGGVCAKEREERRQAFM